MSRFFKRIRGKWLVLIVLLVVLGVGVGAWFLRPEQTDHTQTASGDTASSSQQPTTTVRLVGTGDMIAHEAILEAATSGEGYDFTGMLTNMKPYFEKSDVNFCNQATPAGGEAYGLTGYPVFNAPLAWPETLEKTGCNLINLGTNHTNDKGQNLINATVGAWDNKPSVLATAGANRNQAEHDAIRYFEKDGIKFAFLSYTTYTNNANLTPYGVTMYNKAKAASQISEARTNADIVIVSMRWGTEYSAGVNASQNTMAQDIANAGADIVFGHGPHVLEPVKQLSGKDGRPTLVWFSLGNFLNAQLETEALIGGFAIVDIDKASKKISAPKFMPVYMHYEWTAAQKTAQDLLARKNFSMYPLDQAAEPMSRSLIGTTVDAQTKRVTDVLNTYTPVQIIPSAEF